MRFLPKFASVAGALILSSVVLFLLSIGLSKASTSRSVATWILLLGSAASLAAYYFAVLPLFRHAIDRWTAAVTLPDNDRIKRRIVVVSYTLLFVAVIFVAILSVVDLPSLFVGTSILVPSAFANVYYRLCVPLLALFLGLALIYKLHAATMLDRQKQNIVTLLLPLDDANIIPAAPFLMSSPSSPPPRTHAERLLLEDLCTKAIVAATRVGLRVNPPKAEIVSGIFLADPASRTFVPLATYGGSAAYENAMETFRPPFLDFERFRTLYLEYAKRVADKQPRNLAPYLNEFRRESSTSVSNCGLIFDLERKFSFGPSLYTRCIAHRFEFLARIPEHERRRFMFEESVGLPITILGRKVGVFLLLSNRYGTFYPRDRGLYTAIANLVGLGVRCLFQTRAIEEWVPEARWDRYPMVGADEERRLEIVRFVNSITPNFGWREKP